MKTQSPLMQKASLLILLIISSLFTDLRAQNRCKTAVSNEKFDVYKSAIKAESFTSNQVEVAKQVTYCLNTTQIKAIMEIFSFESNRLDYAKWAYPNCVDKDNYFLLNSAFSFSSSKTELNNFVRSQPKEAEPEPEPPAKTVVVPDQTPINPPKTQVVIPDQTPVTPPKTQVVVPDQAPKQTVPANNPTWNQDNDAYRRAMEQMQNFFIMTLGGGKDAQIKDKTDAHKPDEPESTLPAKAPRVVITAPELNEANQFTARTSEKKVQVTGAISSAVGIYEVFINDTEAILNAKGEFFGDVLLAPGENVVTIKAKDTKGQLASIGFKVIREMKDARPEPPKEVKNETTPPPVPPAPPIDFVSEVDKNVPKLKNSNKDAIAVVIGNRNYTRTKPVDFALNDARSFKNYLINVLGYREGNILYYENATLGDMNTVFGTKGNPKGKLFNTIKQGVSDVVIFYSGHGAPGLKSNKAYFVPVEADPNYMENSGYALDILYENLKKLPAKTITFFSDACFSGANVFENISPMVIRAKEPIKEGLKNTTLINSCTGTEVSCWHKQEQHGLFTFYLLQAMKNYKETDLNKDKQITLDELFKSIADNNEGVPYYARREYGLSQTPVMQGLKTRVLFKYQ
jgi:hypothetical protein